MNSLRLLSRSQIRPRLSKLFSTASKPATRFQEEPDVYRHGGFHRIHLGDTFHHGQYTVLRKLGYGQYSTVWLAKDSKHQKYVALKMLRADCYGGSHDIFEREIHSKISEMSKSTTYQGSNHVSHLLEQFTHTGPNGDHVCLVFDVLGHHLIHQVVSYEDGRLPVKAVKVIARQVLLGLDFLHRECGVIHTDLKPSNILLELKNQTETISRYLADVPPRIDPNYPDGPPLREVIPTALVSDTENIHLRLIDFGVASWRDRHLSEYIQSQALRAPEVTIGIPWDTGVDIWSLGCIITELVQGIVIFSGQKSVYGTWTADDDRLARIMEALGQFPPHLLDKGTKTAEYFDKQGNLIRIPKLQHASLDKILNGAAKPFRKPDDMPPAEVPIFIDFVRGMLTIDPAARKSAAELLQHEWIRP